MGEHIACIHRFGCAVMHKLHVSNYSHIHCHCSLCFLDFFTRTPPAGVTLSQPRNMADSFYKLEDESFPSFLSKSLDNSSGRDTLGNVTLGSGPGLPVAASTVAKIRPCSDNRWVHAATSDRCKTQFIIATPRSSFEKVVSVMLVAYYYSVSF